MLFILKLLCVFKNSVYIISNYVSNTKTVFLCVFFSFECLILVVRMPVLPDELPYCTLRDSRVLAPCVHLVYVGFTRMPYLYDFGRRSAHDLKCMHMQTALLIDHSRYSHCTALLCQDRAYGVTLLHAMSIPTLV